MIPRLTGNAFQMEDGKWGFEVTLSKLGETTGACWTIPVGIETREEAVQELKALIKKLCATIEESAGMEPSNFYFDLQAQMKRPWDEH